MKYVEKVFYSSKPWSYTIMYTREKNLSIVPSVGGHFRPNGTWLPTTREFTLEKSNLSATYAEVDFQIEAIMSGTRRFTQAISSLTVIYVVEDFK